MIWRCQYQSCQYQSFLLIHSFTSQEVPSGFNDARLGRQKIPVTTYYEILQRDEDYHSIVYFVVKQYSMLFNREICIPFELVEAKIDCRFVKSMH